MPLRRPVCVPCAREMRCKKNDYLVSDREPACYVWAGDMFECEGCGHQVVVGWAKEPVRWGHEDGFAEYHARRNLTLAD